ncbi:MAG: hypothetical protein R6U19_06100, partial [Bacteroidales bacterium]
MGKNKTPKIAWIIEGSLDQLLHRNARLKPANELVKTGWEVIMVTSGIPETHKNDPIKFLKVPWPRIYFLGAIIYYLKIIWLFFCRKIDTDIIFFQIDSRSWLLLAIPL